MERIGILVVHGVGEQTQFEHLEALASNLFKALCKDPERKAHLQIRKGDQVPRNSPRESWREAPALLRWRKASGEWLEVCFREVNWADLDMPMNWRGWIKLVFWALAVSGVCLFDAPRVGKPNQHGMCPPKGLKRRERMKVRGELFVISLLFFFMLITVDLLYGLLTRLSFRAQWLKDLRGIIYDYLGDVKLYQDRFVRWDEGLETIGEESRVAIRRRMVCALVRTAIEVEEKKLNGYYIFAHSLGTVVAFNSLMETNLALPNYLTKEEWDVLPNTFKQAAPHDAPERQMPRRPPWLGTRDAINRQQLFAGLRGFLTMGSPLDKFAALWPAIVPVNGQAIPGDVPWVNVADIQDIVAGSIDLFPPCVPGETPPKVGGLRLNNINWADQPTLLSAHTSYWKSAEHKDRLIDRVIPWLEGSQLDKPPHSIKPWLSCLIYWLSFPLIAVLLFLLTASLIWLSGLVGTILQILATATIEGKGMSEWMLSVLDLLLHRNYFDSVTKWMPRVLGIGVLVVFFCSILRTPFEKWKFGRGG